MYRSSFKTLHWRKVEGDDVIMLEWIIKQLQGQAVGRSRSAVRVSGMEEIEVESGTAIEGE